MSLETRVGDVVLSSPLLLASGYITETPDFFLEAREHGCAGMVTRSLKTVVPPERQKVPAPRYVVSGIDMMLNCEWGNEHPWENWRDRWAAQARAKGPIIISMSGRDINSCRELVTAFDAVGVDAFEINVSCSHSGALHGNLNIDINHLEQILRTIRPMTATPIWIKLAFSPILIEMAKQAEEFGADAIVCTNTIGPGMIIDTKTSKPKLGIKGGAGGVSGKAIFPIALRCVYELARAVRIPIVGVGGITTADDVIQMMMAGACAVQLYTLPALRGPKVFRKITRELERFLVYQPEYQDLASLVATAHQWRQEHQFEASKVVVVTEKCSGCQICLPSCAFDAISFNENKVAVIDEKCVGCNACVGVCPPRFDAILPAR